MTLTHKDGLQLSGPGRSSEALVPAQTACMLHASSLHEMAGDEQLNFMQPDQAVRDQP